MAKIASQAPATRTGRPNAAKPSLSDSRGLDIATVLGLTAAFGLVALAIVTGGTPNSFVDPAALMIVIGGTFGVTMMGFSLGEILTAQRVVLKALFRTQRAPRRAANYALQVAEAARGKGVLAIEQILPRMRSEKFLFKALSLVVDGVPADELYKVMERERQATYVRHKASSAVLRRSAEVAPSMGLIGTLVGLVQMLGRLEDPSTIGPAMAVALLTLLRRHPRDDGVQSAGQQAGTERGRGKPRQSYFYDHRRGSGATGQSAQAGNESQYDPVTVRPVDTIQLNDSTQAGVQNASVNCRHSQRPYK